MTSSARGSVALVTLGCTRNEVDSEELAGRLAADGWSLVEDAADADVALVNTCGFIEQAKKDSVDVILEAADLKSAGRTRAVVAVGCLAERYGSVLADELPEADAVLGFDSYAEMSSHLRSVLDGHRPPVHIAADRRRMLPLAPAARPGSAASVALPGHAPSETAVVRARLDQRPWAPLKIASGCDRRCAFCAIPAFRGAFVSRRPSDVLAEARWLAENGVRELLLVSENSTSYGKDLGDLRLLETILPELAAIDGIERVRVSYLQPAEVRPGLLETMAATAGVSPWYDLSFQHASPTVLRRMRRFGGADDFLGLTARVRGLDPSAGIRTNVILGFPGETDGDVETLERFLVDARLDVVGVFGYSDEDGTEAAHLDGHLPADVVAARVERVQALVEELTADRARERVGDQVMVLVEEDDEDDERIALGRADHQGPEVDGICQLRLDRDVPQPPIGSFVPGVVIGADGVDLVVEARG
jgi:ribosomal protein S12 methylthiotransferase